MPSISKWLCTVIAIGCLAATLCGAWQLPFGHQLRSGLLGPYHQAMEQLAVMAGARVGPPKFDIAKLGDEVAEALGGAELHPVVLIPALGGAQMEVQANDKPSVPFFLCRRTFGRVLGWLNLWMLLPGWQQCWADNMRMECDEDGGNCRSPKGVDAGPVRTFNAALSLDPLGMFRVYGDLVNVLERSGWQRGKNLDAHVYDTRLVPDDHSAPGGAFGLLRQQIEAMVAANGDRPAVLVGVATAPRYVARFLNTAVDAEWRAKHVASLVSISGVWGGAPYYALTMLSGSWGGRWGGYLSKSAVQRLAAGIPSLAWMLPLPGAFGSSRALVSNTALNTSYTADDMGKLLRTAGLTQASAVYERLVRGGAMDAVASRPPADTTTYCLYGTQMETPVGVTYASGSFRDEPSLITSDGDGRVPHESLSLCRWWGGSDGSGNSSSAVGKTVVVEFPNLGHGGLLHDSDGVRWVARSILGAHSEAAATAL